MADGTWELQARTCLRGVRHVYLPVVCCHVLGLAWASCAQACPKGWCTCAGNELDVRLSLLCIPLEEGVAFCHAYTVLHRSSQLD